MKPLHKGLIVALVHLVLVSTLGAKLLYDRRTRPRVWVKSAPYDPSLPIRGRYVRLRLELHARGFTDLERQRKRATLGVEDGRLVASPTDSPDGQWVGRPFRAGGNRGRALASALGIPALWSVAPPFATHLSVKGGAIVNTLKPESAAQAAGLAANDVIVSVGEQAVSSPADLYRMFEERQGKREIPLQVLRGHERLSLLIVRKDVVDSRDESSRALFLSEPVAFFIPEHVPDPSRRPPGEALWVEVTLPRKGPPRPIRLGVSKHGGAITPLDLD